MKRKYNWKPDQADSRDYPYALKVQRSLAPLPTKVDLSPLCSPVFDQGEIGSCTGNALAGMFEFLELKGIKNKEVTGSENPEIFDAAKYNPVSRLFIYYNERLAEGTVHEDAGASLRTGIKVVGETGVCRENIWDYKPENVFVKPVQSAYEEASNHKISTYHRLDHISDMKHCLAEGFPFVFGMMIFQAFEEQAIAETGKLSLPKPTEQSLGGHAILAVGYDDNSKMFKIRNSWGTGWGQDGYFEMPYDYISNPDLCLDFWTIRK